MLRNRATLSLGFGASSMISLRRRGSRSNGAIRTFRTLAVALAAVRYGFRPLKPLT